MLHCVQLLEVERQNDALKRMLNSGSVASFNSSQADRLLEDDKLHRLCTECVHIVDGLSEWLWQEVTRWTNECVMERWNEEQMVVKRDSLLDETDAKTREARSRIERAEREMATATT